MSPKYGVATKLAMKQCSKKHGWEKGQGKCVRVKRSAQRTSTIGMAQNTPLKKASPQHTGNQKGWIQKAGEKWNSMPLAAKQLAVNAAAIAMFAGIAIGNNAYQERQKKLFEDEYNGVAVKDGEVSSTGIDLSREDFFNAKLTPLKMSEHNAPKSEIFTAEINGNHYFVKKAPNLECVSEVLSKKFADELGVGEYVLPAKSFYTKGQDKGFVVMPLIPGIQTAFEAMKNGVELPGLDNDLVGKLETFDRIIDNVDRHLNNVIFHEETNSYLLIDNALSFASRGFHLPQRDLIYLAKDVKGKRPLDTEMIKKAQDRSFYGLIDEAFSGFQQKTSKDKKKYYKISIEDLAGKSNVNKQDSIIATAIAIKKDGGCGRGRVDNGNGQCVPSKNRGKKFRERALQTAMVGLPIAAGTLSLARQGQKIHKQWQESRKIKEQGESANQTVENIREATRETEEQKKARREAYEQTGRDLSDKVDEMLRKKYPDSSYARQERPASKQTVDVKARTVDSAVSVKNDGCGKGMVGFQGRCIRARNALAGVAAIGATAVGGGLYLHNRQKQQKEADFKSRFAEEVKKKRRELNTKRVQERRTKLEEPTGGSLLLLSEIESNRNLSNQDIKGGQKPDRSLRAIRKWAGGELARKAAELRASGNYDSLIATAIAMRMDRGCGKRMKGEGGKCVPAGGRLAQGMNEAVSSGNWGAAQKFGGQIVANENRLAQERRKKFKQSAGNAFRGTASALNRSADVIQKTAATAIAAKTLHELSKRNQEKKDSYIATTIAIKKDGGCGRGMVGFQGRWEH